MSLPPLLWHSLPLRRVQVKEVMSPFCVCLGCWVLLPCFWVHEKSHKPLVPLHRLPVSFACINFIVCLGYLTLYLFSMDSEVYEIFILPKLSLLVFEILYYVCLSSSLSSCLKFQHWTNMCQRLILVFFLVVSLWMFPIPATDCKSAGIPHPLPLHSDWSKAH